MVVNPRQLFHLAEVYNTSKTDAKTASKIIFFTVGLQKASFIANLVYKSQMQKKWFLRKLSEFMFIITNKIILRTPKYFQWKLSAWLFRFNPQRVFPNNCFDSLYSCNFSYLLCRMSLPKNFRCWLIWIQIAKFRQKEYIM